jgi:hypothetical protein
MEEFMARNKNRANTSNTTNETTQGNTMAEQTATEENMNKSEEQTLEQVAQQDSGTETPTTEETPTGASEPTEKVLAVEEKQPEPEVQQPQEPTPVVVTAVASGPVEEAKESGSLSAKTVIAFLEMYVDKMKPGMAVEAEDGARAQLLLWRTIRNLIESETDDFAEVFGLVLTFAHTHTKGAFADTHLFRFTESINMGSIETKAFLAILNLIQTTADPRGRKTAMKQIDFHRTMANYWSENARQRVAGFYNL